jgi:hypothetical protein
LRISALAALAALALVASCGGGDDATCGPGSAADDGLVATASAGSITLTFGGILSGQNNDCPGSNAPAGVISLTMIGTQSDGSGGITLCVARPDELATQALALGPDVASSPVRLIDLNGTAGGCSLAIDTTQPATGTVSATGLCGNGSDAAGFALTVQGTVPLTRSCAGSGSDSVTVTLAGTAAVHPGL